MASPRTPEPEDSATEPKTRKPFILNRWLRTGWNWYKESMQGYGAAWPRITTLIVATLLVVWLLLHIGRWTDFDSKSRVAQLEGQLKEARAQSGTTIDTSKLVSASQMTELENIAEKSAKSEEIKGIADTLGEINASLKLLAEKPAVDVSKIATEEKVAELLDRVDGLPARIPNPDVIAWLKGEEGQKALKALAPSVDTSALEKAVADLGTKVGETPTTVIAEIKALREEVAKISAPVQTDNAALAAMTAARDEVVTQLRANEAKLAAAEAATKAMEKFADDSVAWMKKTVKEQLKYEFVQDPNGGWVLNPIE